MAGSAAEAPTTPDAEPVGRVRASDAERDQVLARLREEFAAGRLSHDTFLLRMDAVLQARHLADLPPLLEDLPAPAEQPPAPAPEAPAPAALTPGSDEPPMPWPGTEAPLPEPGGLISPAGQASLAGWLRSALDRALRPGATRAGDLPPRTASGRGAPARRLTLGMVRADGDSKRLFRGARRGIPAGPAERLFAHQAQPLPLRFPRGRGVFFSIGRDRGCDLAIADMTVSRVHARLERTADGWLLTDLASTNGTRVNGWRVRGEVEVKAGDLVSFGQAEYWLSGVEGI
jgi:hypothetical protein